MKGGETDGKQAIGPFAPHVAGVSDWKHRAGNPGNRQQARNAGQHGSEF